MVKTAFSELHPIVCLIYFIGLLVLAMIMSHPLYLLLLFFVLLLVTLLYVKLSKKMLLRYLVFFLFIIVLNPLFVREGTTILFSITGITITLEAVIYGLKSGLMILLLLLTFIPFNKVITNNKLLYLFSNLFPKGAMLLALALRFVPLFKRRLEHIHETQVTRGISVLEGSFQSRAKAGMTYMHILLTLSLEEAIQTADSMKARGYNGNHNKRSAYQYFRIQWKDRLSLIFLLISIVVLVIGKIKGFGSYIFFPVLQGLQLQPYDFVMFVILVIYTSYPLLLEAGSQLRWQLLNYKI